MTRAASLTLATGIVMLFAALGLLFMFENFMRHATLVLPFSIPVLAILFAVIFVVGTALLEMRGAGHVRSLWSGAVLGALLTALALLVYGGILYLLNVGGPYNHAPNAEELLIAAAVCVVASAVATRLLPS